MSVCVCVCVCVQEHLTVPGDKVMSEISSIFSRMTKTYCAISKLEFLLEAVRLTYENVSPLSLSLD